MVRIGQKSRKEGQDMKVSAGGRRGCGRGTGGEVGGGVNGRGQREAGGGGGKVGGLGGEGKEMGRVGPQWNIGGGSFSLDHKPNEKREEMEKT